MVKAMAALLAKRLEELLIASDMKECKYDGFDKLLFRLSAEVFNVSGVKYAFSYKIRRNSIANTVIE